jgi:hypothetical protein
MHLESESKAGIPLIRHIGSPGTQGVVTGIHGIGVNTPSAAAVAAATSGLLGVMHMPNGGIFAIGAKSMMVAEGAVANTFGASTIREDGATPNVHIIIAPITTCSPMPASGKKNFAPHYQHGGKTRSTSS